MIILAIYNSFNVFIRCLNFLFANYCSKVEEYMEQLDNNKIPRVGSAGEKYRDVQLVVQLPKHDLSELYVRHLKTPGQKQGFHDFRVGRDAEAMGIAQAGDCEKRDMVGI